MLMGKVKAKECEAGRREDGQRDLKGEKGGQEDRERRVSGDGTHLSKLTPMAGTMGSSAGDDSA